MRGALRSWRFGLLAWVAGAGCFGGPSAVGPGKPDATVAAAPDAHVVVIDAPVVFVDAQVIDASRPDAAAPADAAPAVDAGPVTVSRTHWRLSFADEFKGKQGAPSDAYCYDQLKPQCHVWPGTSHNCDLSDVSGDGFFPPTKANLVAAIKLVDPNHDFASMSVDDVKALYGQIIGTRLASLNKCNWTMYDMVNWMATDYAGNYSARFDPMQVVVDPTGKGYLELSASYAPVQTDCIYGGSLGGPNCSVYSFAAGVLNPGVHYWAEPNPAYPGVYYAPVNGNQCPYGGTFGGVNCTVIGFPPHFLEETGVAYWVDPNPAFPGVYYANATYRCKDNIDYTPTLGFRNLTCPILDGGLMSYGFTNRPWTDANGVDHQRGEMQKQGRFEAKARIPKGVGAFPATWLMPQSGGWPYTGGEIDVLEARDAADEVYQTYHHGKCFLRSTGMEIVASDSGDCATKGGESTHLDLGYTVKQQTTDEFWQRDHLFAVEWTDNKFTYYINNVPTGTITVGTKANADNNAPAALAVFEASNFPTSPFYWILNHSTYVPPDKQAGFATETFLIDYIRNYVACGTDNAEYCPQGGLFQENVGCVGAAGGTYASPCQPSTRACVNGGTLVGGRCLVYTFDPGVVMFNITYWADADPRWPGVYYQMINGQCPFGGSGTVNCQLLSLPGDMLEGGIHYNVDAAATPPGIYYIPDFK